MVWNRTRNLPGIVPLRSCGPFPDRLSRHVDVYPRLWGPCFAASVLVHTWFGREDSYYPYHGDARPVAECLCNKFFGNGNAICDLEFISKCTMVSLHLATPSPFQLIL